VDLSGHQLPLRLRGCPKIEGARRKKLLTGIRKGAHHKPSVMFPATSSSMSVRLAGAKKGFSKKKLLLEAVPRREKRKSSIRRRDSFSKSRREKRRTKRVALNAVAGGA